MTDPRPKPAGRDFSALTEATGTPLSREGADMVYSRYAYGAELAAGARVLEIACGSGQGVGMLGERASFVVGGDIDQGLLRRAKLHYGRRARLACLDACDLPFPAGSFDLVLFFEALYYVPAPSRALDEVARVLAPEGRVVVVNANPERPDFIRSPRSFTYHTADALRRELEARGLEVRVEGAYPARESGLLGRAAPAIRRVMEALGLVPRTLAGRARLKRLLLGPLISLPPEITAGFGSAAERVPLPAGAASGYKVLYVTGSKPRDIFSG
jgi:SAM-dependent methyltransferase